MVKRFVPPLFKLNAPRAASIGKRIGMKKKVKSRELIFICGIAYIKFFDLKYAAIKKIKKKVSKLVITNFHAKGCEIPMRGRA
jgi:hypothetical protein